MMEETYREIELGAAGIAYIRECLEAGKTFARLLLQTHDLNMGKAVTKLPASVDDEAAKDFDSGGKLPELYPRTTNLQAVPDSDFLMMPEINRFLSESSANICILEDSLANPTDPFLQSVKTRYSAFQDEVYHLICQPDNNSDTISKTLRQAHSWLTIGALTSAPEEMGVCAQLGELKLSSLTTLAQKAQEIIVGAYDGEGYVIWTANN
jgi:hypothetical protein